ncbi:MAG: outer membrane beta-barrel protein [Prevotella sp.]|nr:outer membrane beta-barrel protein [Prevotella sp.]
MKMKTQAAILMALLLTGHTAIAQNKRHTLTIQPKVGLAFATLSGNGLKYDASWKVGPAAGVELEWGLDDMQAITVGLGYRSVGAAFDYVISNDESPWSQVVTRLDNFTLQYLSLPVQYKVGIIPNVALHFGVELNGLLSARAHASAKGRAANSLYSDGSFNSDDDPSLYQWHKVNEKTSEGIGSQFKNFTVSIPVGLSYEYRRFVLSATYHFEVTSAHFEAYFVGNTPLDDGYKIHNQAIDLTLGYRFNLR